MEKRRANQRSYHGWKTARISGNHGTHAEHEHAAQRRQATVTLAQRAAALGVERDVDSSPLRVTHHLGLEVLSPVVDAMRVSCFEQARVLAGAGGADRTRAAPLADLQRGEADTAAGRVDQNGV